MNKCLHCYKEIEGDADFHAKCSKEFFGDSKPPQIPYSFEQMTDLAKDIVERSVSVPGVQPKLSMTIFTDEKNKADKRLTVIGALGGNYILKPPSLEFEQMPENENLTMRLAGKLGINVVPSSLIRLKYGELAYITKRIDRKADGEKIHMLDMFQILEAFDKYKGSMEKIGKALSAHSTNPLLDKLFLFELTVFCFLTGNNDMHLKNFSMINGKLGWVLSPAYDLLNVKMLLPEDKEQLALTMGGKKLKITKAIFDQFGFNLGLNEKQLSTVHKRFSTKLPELKLLIQQSFLSDNLKVSYMELLEERFSVFRAL